MAMAASEIEKLIKEAFTTSRVQQHQMVYDAFKGRMGGVA
jgi:stress-induced morphogen